VSISRLLVVDDDDEMRDMMTEYLRKHGFMALGAASLAEIEAAMSAGRIDLILLDVMLGCESGLEICAALRRDQDVPIIMVSALSADHQRMAGYEVGADDYIAKPFNPDLLLARVRAVLRRRGGSARNEIPLGEALFDPMSGTLRAGGESVTLRNRETRLLEVFARHPGQTFSKGQLLDRLFSFDAEVTENAIEVYVGRLRKRIGPLGLRIETVRGLGYRLETAPA